MELERHQTTLNPHENTDRFSTTEPEVALRAMLHNAALDSTLISLRCFNEFFGSNRQKDEWRITELFRGIRKVPDVIARFGPPDEEREFASGVRSPSRDGAPERGEVFRGLVYKNLSPVADIVFKIGDSDSVRGSWSQKYVGEKHPG